MRRGLRHEVADSDAFAWMSFRKYSFPHAERIETCCDLQDTVEQIGGKYWSHAKGIEASIAYGGPLTARCGSFRVPAGAAPESRCAGKTIGFRGGLGADL